MPRSTRAVERRGVSLPTDNTVDQAGAKAANINNLMAQYLKNGTMPAVAQHDGLYGDFSSSRDLHDQYEAVQAAQDRFDLLPASVRKTCDHSPVKFLELTESDEGVRQLMDAGLTILDNDGVPIPRPDEAPEAPSEEPSEGSPTRDEGADPA